jgi:hypothetical protein
MRFMRYDLMHYEQVSCRWSFGGETRTLRMRGGAGSAAREVRPHSLSVHQSGEGKDAIKGIGRPCLTRTSGREWIGERSSACRGFHCWNTAGFGGIGQESRVEFISCVSAQSLY